MSGSPKPKTPKSPVSINKFKPKITPIEQSIATNIYRRNKNSTSINAKDSDSETKKDTNDSDSLDNEDEKVFKDSDSDSFSSEDASTKPETAKENTKYSYFNSLTLEGKQQIVKNLISSTSGAINLKLLKIDQILTFLSDFEELTTQQCFELSIDNPELSMTSEKGKKSKNFFNTLIQFETVKVIQSNGKIKRFLKNFKDFFNVSIQLEKPSEVFEKLNETIKEIHKKYGQFNIVLYVKKAVVEDQEFGYNEAISSVILTPSVHSVGKQAFLGCSSMINLTISDSVTEIMVAAFQRCSSLKEVVIPDSVESLLEYTFSKCESLQSVTLSSSLNGIRVGVFDMCVSLQGIEFPDSIKFIGRDAFNGCSSLTKVTIPESVQKLNEFAFANCTSLSRVDMPDSVKYEPTSFKNCPLLKGKFKYGRSPTRGGHRGGRGDSRGGKRRGGGNGKYHRKVDDNDNDDDDDDSF
ncbi:hypothetical protein M9Y10_032507 [Tritrichomonas musculus]|uniref:Surface antigen BspA-like n=1 Tax=Tritrichomonas musculus TaxID=1915356 RepID=A0ABR2GZD2_9EUKA